MLVLGFESTDHPVEARPRRGRCGSAASTAASGTSRRGDGGGSRRGLARGVHPHALPAGHADATGHPADTFETAITWDRFPAFHETVLGAVREALGEPCRVTCRFTHVYPDGPAPYITVIAPARRGDEVAQWHEMKRAAGDAIIAGGGTITHHHAVGRDHRPWYDRAAPGRVRRSAARREGGGGPGRRS